MTHLNTKSGEFWRFLIRIAVPIALQQLLINSLSFIDTLFISQLGDISLSASGMAFQYNWLLNMITFGFCSGATLFVSQFWGAKKYDDITKTYKVSTICTLVISVVFTLLALFIPEKIMSVFNSNPLVIKEGAIYLKYVCYAYIPTALTSIMGSILRSCENVKLPMAVSVISISLNIFLDYAMIFGKFGFDKMGIMGGAIATAISAWVGFVALIFISYLHKNVLIVSLKDFLKVKFLDFKIFMKRAFPVVFNELTWGLGTVVTNAIYSNTGYQNFAACTILRTVESMCLILFIGLNDGGAVIIGKTIGEKDHNRAYSYAKKLAITVPLISLLVGSVAVIFRHSIVGIFNMSSNISSVSVDLASVLIIIYGLELCLRNIPYTMVCAIFRSGGDTVTPVKYDLTCLWVLAIPTTFVLANFTNLAFPIIFLCHYLVEDIPKVFMCIRHFVSKRWIKPVV